MVKFVLCVVFLMPVSLISYWLTCFYLFFLSFLFLLLSNIGIEFNFISYNLGCDFLSYLMVLLSFWICSLMILASVKVLKKNFFPHMFGLLILFLMLSLMMTFYSLNMFMFYLFFEISLIPTFLLIIGWGYQPERLEAGLYLLFYTLFFSLPMMVSIFYCYTNIYSLEYFKLNIQLDIYMFFCMNMVFLVKIPMFFIHLWLPKAHVEAPVSGSMILAGVMLKLGGFGLMRFLKFFLFSSISTSVLLITISLFGGFMVSLLCLRQSDMKSLVAYSSVGHMGVVLSGLLTLSIWGYHGGLILMLGHGFCSSGLFCLINLSYERFNSRSFYLNKGFINLIPSLSLWWFLFSACNMAAPPSLNLLGEICLINSIICYSSYTMFFMVVLAFFASAYSLYLYAFSQHGFIGSGSYSFSSGYLREYLLMFLHWIPLNLLIMKADFLFNL
uniref:NADH dehydrogenase subunit 4 n=1 Tax=Cryptocephalus dimidiatipennis TaxID=2978450 RepID=UPI0021CCFF6E|nr:NADH dehydrogenase subunit 4 [Cryptocephalus dimidiatipennis]UWV18205.1 NADH dehydrogenase subunit 4 [Cryptocephalus dimidiatipennis]